MFAKTFRDAETHNEYLMQRLHFLGVYKFRATISPSVGCLSVRAMKFFYDRTSSRTVKYSLGGSVLSIASRRTGNGGFSKACGVFEITRSVIRAAQKRLTIGVQPCKCSVKRYRRKPSQPCCQDDSCSVLIRLAEVRQPCSVQEKALNRVFRAMRPWGHALGEEQK